MKNHRRTSVSFRASLGLLGLLSLSVAVAGTVTTSRAAWAGRSGAPAHTASAAPHSAKPAHSTTLHFTRSGKGPAVVFLHGLGGDSASWIEEAQRLEKTHTVVLVDLPGHGASKVPPQGIDLLGIGREIALLIQNERLAPATIVGHSIGGTIAGYVALADKTVVRSLVMVDSLLQPYPIARSERDKIRFQLGRDPAKALTDFFGAGTRNRDQLDKIIAGARRVDAKTFMGYLDFASERDDLVERIEEIHVPVYAIASPLMTQGKSEPIQVQASLAQAGFAGLRDFSFDYLADARHWPHWDQPDLFHASLSKFLARVEGPPAQGRPVAKVPGKKLN